MHNMPPFSAFFSANLPFVARAALEPLRSWVRQSPWFRDHDTDAWFEVDAAALECLQSEYNGEWATLGMQMLTQQPFAFTDSRFAGSAWNQPLFGSLAALYLLNSRFLMRLLDLLPIDSAKLRTRLAFLVEQLIAAGAPSNFLGSNPEALERAIDTGGASLFSGLLHLASDLKEGKLRQCDSAAFEVGVNLATTPGQVVYQNPLFQLIQYAPQSATQYKRPLLLVPPAINKYYILDMQPESSFVRNALEQGHPVYLVSWRNADESLAATTWDDYVEQGIVEAIKVTQAISGEQQLNLLGYCVGGTLLACGLGVLAARGEKPAASLTLLVTLLDFEDPGVLGVFIDEKIVRYREHAIGGAGGHYGLFRGEDMGNTFSLLRPNELWWNYGVDKYLKGQKPRSLDLLYWNNDHTHLPGAMYCWYLRHTYLQNELKTGKLEVCGETLDLSRLDMPTYVVGAREDHIVPWRSAFTSARLLKGPTRFVLGASGHIAGIINPASKNKRNYWTSDALPADPDQWLEGATEQPGSWWLDWTHWLGQHAGKQGKPITRLGSADYPPLEPAPGQYVLARS
ncbi:class I poly(R)-hydroxyalkanoic acid synthase [Pseudomonas sp. MAP12]|uniref:Class I poly(R)-hydroxyalkanoic acid synthase n=1 Tax=Geopseudomonas aromaticivorans TaxID=2849492 RepID=A0ABS6MTK6_9GAMM|nr:class I poly(R)-hydroxyalkanoic acid synthase [Pseudomonas aromaticivorans]MBV2132085.1 class I poly(R)-hydroxyalkanoic acid synthase [Pseudomonas aromaticivorans]